MNPSTLQLNGYFFTDSSVTCLYGSVLPDTQVVIRPSDLECEIETLEPTERHDESKPMGSSIRMKLATKEGEDSAHLHYQFTLEAIGNIAFVKPLEDAEAAGARERIEKTLVINAANLLYGVMRERLHSQTSTMMWGPLLLPTVTFDGLRKSQT